MIDATMLRVAGDQDETARPARSIRSTRWATPGFLEWLGVTFVALFGLAWIYVAAAPMAFLSRDYPLWVAKRTMLDACQLGSVAVFGDSRTLAAIDPRVMPVAVKNFALSGTSPIETYFAVSRALRCPTPPRLVVIAHGPLKFTADPDYWNFGARTGFLGLRAMRLVDDDAGRLHDRELQRLRRGDQLPPMVRDLLFAVRFPGFYFDSLVNAGLAARWAHNRRALHDCLSASGHALFGTASGSSELTTEVKAGNASISPLIDLYLSRTLGLLAKRGVPVLLLAMPINQASYDRVPKRVGEQVANYLRATSMRFHGTRVVGPAVPCWPDRFFGDAWHFNANGAEAYSRELGEWLRAELAGRNPAALADRCGHIG